MTTRRRFSGTHLLRRFGTLIGLLLIVGVFAGLRPETFPTLQNLLNISQQMSILGVVAFTMTLVMVMNDFDLSVGAMASLAGIVAGLVFQQGGSAWAGIGAALLTGVIGGLLNGLVIAYVGISPFVATLGTLTLFSGLAFLLSDGKTIFGRAIPAEFSGFAKGGLPLGMTGDQQGTLPNLTILALVVLLVVLLVLSRTVYGRRLYALGSNREAARLVGLRVRFLRGSAFLVTGFGAALAGLMLASRLASANPTQGDGLMLNAIAAVFLGMTTREDGTPHVLGTLVGVLILGVLGNGLTQLSINSYIQQMLTGAIIIGAVAISRLGRAG